MIVFLLLYRYPYYVIVCFVWIYLKALITYNTYRNKKTQKPLELEWRTIVSCHVGVGNPTWVLWKRIQFSKTLSAFSSPTGSYLLTVGFIPWTTWDLFRNDLPMPTSWSELLLFLWHFMVLNLTLVFDIYLLVVSLCS